MPGKYRVCKVTPKKTVCRITKTKKKAYDEGYRWVQTMIRRRKTAKFTVEKKGQFMWVPVKFKFR